MSYLAPISSLFLFLCPSCRRAGRSMTGRVSNPSTPLYQPGSKAKQATPKLRKSGTLVQQKEDRIKDKQQTLQC